MARLPVLRRTKWRLGIGLALVVAVAALVALAALRLTAAEVSFKEADGKLFIRNAHYEIVFEQQHGSIVELWDKSAAGGKVKIEAANRGGALWWAFLDEETPVDGAQTDFSYSYNRRKGELSFHYTGGLDVDVVTSFSANNRIAMRAEVKNVTPGTVSSFRFPYELKLAAEQIADGLVPMLPGARLTHAFFRENNSYQAQYPGIMFAPYLGVRTAQGNLALYDLQDGPTATMELGFKNQVDDAGKTALVHNYKTWISPAASWSSPTVVLEIGGGDYAASINSYRELSGMAKYPSLADKLKDDKDKVLALPFLKLDISALQKQTWASLTESVVDRLSYPAVLHLVGFQKGGHDENYPDFLPADAAYGSTEELIAFLADAKAKGNRAVPYTNFSWWGNHAPTLADLPGGLTLEDIIVKKKNGAVLKEDYGNHSGYVVNPSHPFVRERIAQEHEKLLAVGMDGIFEDQWGIRDVPFVHDTQLAAGTDPSTSYYAGMRDYFASLAHPLYTEDGFDSLAEHALGFMGTNYLWDLLAYRKNTASYTEYYPMIGMLARDKVQLFQHDLAAETMTDDKEMLRWNAAMGYNLSADLFHGTDNPWVDLVGVFQKYVLAPYGDALVLGYTDVAPGVTRTDFGEYTVLANWSSEQGYETATANAPDTAATSAPVTSTEATSTEATSTAATSAAVFTLAPGGFEIRSSDGNVRAGSYTHYNGQELDAGDHILVELREADGVRVFQPVGADTTVAIAKAKGWNHTVAAAYRADGTKIADLPVTEEGGLVRFDYIARLLEQKTGYVLLTESDTPSTVGEVSFHKVKVYANLGVGKKIVASSVTTDDYPPTAANDGDPYTYWESTAKQFPQTLTLDLGSDQDISRVLLRLPPQTAWEAREQIVAVSASVDGQSYAELAPAQSLTFDPATNNAVEVVFPPATARYVRITVTGNTSWPAAQISEFEVYGAEE